MEWIVVRLEFYTLDTMMIGLAIKGAFSVLTNTTLAL